MCCVSLPARLTDYDFMLNIKVIDNIDRARHTTEPGAYLLPPNILTKPIRDIPTFFETEILLSDFYLLRKFTD